MNDNKRSEADAVAEIATLAASVERISLPEPDEGDRLLIGVPAGTKLESIKRFVDEYRTAPERKKGTAKFADLVSFIAHANRFKDTDSALFADPTVPSLTSVLDYHREGEGDARFGTHRGVYTFPLSEEWQAWKALDGKPMSQAEFAEFLENRLLDVADPAGAHESSKAFAVNLGSAFASPSKLLELSRGLTVRTSARVTNATNLATGEASMVFETSHADESGAPLRIPGAFLIVLPVFRLGALYQLPVRLRYRVRDKSVSWFFELYRADRIFDDAFRGACEAAQGGTDLPFFTGTPEA